MADSKKCAHPVCSCNVTSGKYCSTEVSVRFLPSTQDAIGGASFIVAC
jgi:hypothetical protein